MQLQLSQLDLTSVPAWIARHHAAATLPAPAVTHGAVNHFSHVAPAPGSPLVLMLVLLALHNSSWACLVFVTGPVTMRLAALTAPLVAVLPRVSAGGPGGAWLGCVASALAELRGVEGS